MPNDNSINACVCSRGFGYIKIKYHIKYTLVLLITFLKFVMYKHICIKIMWYFVFAVHKCSKDTDSLLVQLQFH